jgi:cytochrome c biogenesis protein CcdA
VSNGKDSIAISIVPDSIYKVKDTLFVKPCMVEENRFLDVDNSYSGRKYYDCRSKTILKVPLNQIVKIRAKKQPIAFILGTTTTLAYITYLTSIFVAVVNPKYEEVALKTFFASGAVLITFWPSYFIWGKKRFWFQSKKNKTTWTFD